MYLCHKEQKYNNDLEKAILNKSRQANKEWVKIKDISEYLLLLGKNISDEDIVRIARFSERKQYRLSTNLIYIKLIYM